MSDKGYDIVHFHPEHESQVLDILKNLWKYNHDTFTDLFRWKYFDNPHTKMPLGIVALHKGRVVGFRGYFADRFFINENNDNIIILHPGDTCVDPNHRREGLSVAMGNLAMQYNYSMYPLFMNMTCTPPALPGYLRMGFQPLAKKINLKQRSLNPLGLYRQRKAQRENLPPAESRIKLGQFGDILVRDSPLPEAMASIINAQGYSNGTLSLYQDRVFFEWRFRNPVQKYIFYYLMRGNAVRGYLVISVSPNNLRGAILDYGECEDQAIKQILRFIIKAKQFYVLTIYDYGVDDQLRTVLSDLSFSINHPLKKIFRKKSSEQQPLPILIRPVKKSFTEKDFIIGGVDVRKIENWRLKPICSDAA